MAYENSEVIAPKQIIIPTTNPVTTIANAKAGTLSMSGAKLYIYSGSAWEMITSA